MDKIHGVKLMDIEKLQHHITSHNITYLMISTELMVNNHRHPTSLPSSCKFQVVLAVFISMQLFRS